MSETSATKRTESCWLTYLKALAFLLPALAAWASTCVFILPKLKQSFAAAGLDLPAQGWLWTTPSVLILLLEHALLLAILLALALLLLEWFVRSWARYRRVVAGSLVWLANVGVLVALIDLLILAAIVVPG